MPTDRRVAILRNDKREKYVRFVASLKRKTHKFVDFIPLIIGATGIVPDETSAALRRLDANIELTWLQKIATTSTTKFFRDLIL